MAKPTKSTEWATDGAALKADPDAGQISYGWSTSDNTVNGTPVKPNLQQQNGWQNAVHKWKEYFEATTDQNISDISDNAQAISSNASDISDLTSLIGIGVPLGGIIGVATDLPGTFNAASGDVLNGYMLCDGTNIPGGNAVSGATPDLTDNRFLMGSTTSGNVGGNSGNTINLSHSHVVNSHNHDMAHVHQHTYQRDGSFADSNLYSLSGPTGKNLEGFSHASGGTVQWADDWSASNSNSNIPNVVALTTDGTRNLWTSGAHNGSSLMTNTGSASPGTDSALSSTQSILPLYHTVRYFIRVN